MWKKFDIIRYMKIEVDKNGIAINGHEVSFPTNVKELSKILGEPTRNYYENNDWRIIWDDKGISTSGTDITSLMCVIAPEERLPHLPKQVFTGELIVDGTPVQVQDAEVTKLNKYKVSQARYMGEETEPIFAYRLGINYDYVDDMNASKYVLQKISGTPITFKDFNFKLAIIEELMYRQKLIEPQFDIFEFARLYKDRAIDVNKEGDTPIPEAIEYFKGLEIDTKLAEKVTSLYQDGGNDIYMNIAPFWDGSDDTFDIASFDDVATFPNLTHMTLFQDIDAIAGPLKAQGIEVEQL